MPLLLVEDEQILALSQIHLLGKHGYETLHASSGNEALSMIDECEDIELVLMDIDLGKGIDGTETAQKILDRQELPIVFLSCHTEEAVIQQVKNITRYGYVLKTSGEFVLIEAIDMALQLFHANKLLKEEIQERRLSEKKAANRMAEIRFLHKAAGGLLEIKSEQNIYRYIANALMELNPGAIIIINSVDMEGGSFCTKAIAGLHPKLEKAFELIGYHPVGASYTIDRSLWGLLSGKLTRFEGGLHELSFESIPLTVARTMERLLSIQEIHGIGLIADGQMFANAALLFFGENRLERRQSNEAFVQNAAIALKRWQAEKMLKTHYIGKSMTNSPPLSPP